MATTSRYCKFSSGKVARKDDTVVYVAGAFDLFHAGHIALLEKARHYGTFVLVGVYDDQTVNAFRGGGAPILNMHERVLSCLSCCHVDEVIMGPPVKVTQDMMTTMNISVVLYADLVDQLHADTADTDHAYEVPIAAGKFKRVDGITTAGSVLTTERVIERISANWKQFETKVAGKKIKEVAYGEQKQYVQEG